MCITKKGKKHKFNDNDKHKLWWHWVECFNLKGPSNTKNCIGHNINFVYTKNLLWWNTDFHKKESIGRENRQQLLNIHTINSKLPCVLLLLLPNPVLRAPPVLGGIAGGVPFIAAVLTWSISWYSFGCNRSGAKGAIPEWFTCA